MGASRKAAVAAIGSAAAGWEVQRRLDRRAIARDPMHALLSDPPRGRAQAVVARDGTRLHAEVFGPDDAPTIVFVHGWTCAWEFWQLQIRALMGDVRLVAFDLRGHGRSEHAVTGDYSMEAFADDLQAVLEQCVPGGERAVLAGHSLGAMSIVAWAGRHPREVQARAGAAALICTGMGDLISETLVVRMPTALGRLQQAVGAAVLSAPAVMPKGPTPLVFRATRYVALSPGASPAVVAFCERMVIACPNDVRGACGRSLSRLELTDSIAHLTVPTLVVAGERDKLTPPTHAERLAEALPDVAELAIVPGAGHMAPLEEPDLVTARLRAVFERAHAGVPALHNFS